MLRLLLCLFACDACRMILYDVVFVEACQRNASMSDGLELVGSLRRMIPQVFGQWTVCLVGSCHICWTLVSEGWHFAMATLSNSWPIYVDDCFILFPCRDFWDGYAETLHTCHDGDHKMGQDWSVTTGLRECVFCHVLRAGCKLCPLCVSNISQECS